MASARHLQDAFEMDEKLWPDRVKAVRGQEAGVPYEITYPPSEDIAGTTRSTSSTACTPVSTRTVRWC
jgi:hypothetical protein